MFPFSQPHLRIPLDFSDFQSLSGEVSSWKTLNLFRCVGAILGWLLVALRPTTDLLHKHLRRQLAEHGKDKDKQQQIDNGPAVISGQ